MQCFCLLTSFAVALPFCYVGEREGYSKRLHTMPEADCTGKNELLMMSFLKARNM